MYLNDFRCSSSRFSQYFSLVSPLDVLRFRTFMAPLQFSIFMIASRCGLCCNLQLTSQSECPLLLVTKRDRLLAIFVHLFRQTIFYGKCLIELRLLRLAFVASVKKNTATATAIIMCVIYLNFSLCNAAMQFLRLHQLTNINQRNNNNS